MFIYFFAFWVRGLLCGFFSVFGVFCVGYVRNAGGVLVSADGVFLFVFWFFVWVFVV